MIGCANYAGVNFVFPRFPADAMEVHFNGSHDDYNEKKEKKEKKKQQSTRYKIKIGSLVKSFTQNCLL